jgi:hypothetical protein
VFLDTVADSSAGEKCSPVVTVHAPGAVVNGALRRAESDFRNPPNSPSNAEQSSGELTMDVGGEGMNAKTHLGNPRHSALAAPFA